jgi:hypothetical protein
MGIQIVEIRDIPPEVMEVASQIPRVKTERKDGDAVSLTEDDRYETYVSELRYLAGHPLTEGIDQDALIKALGTGENGGDGRIQCYSKKPCPWGVLAKCLIVHDRALSSDCKLLRDIAQLCHEIALLTNSGVHGQTSDVTKESHSVMKIHLLLNAEQDIFGLLFDTIGLTPATIGKKRPRTASEKGAPFRLQAPGEVSGDTHGFQAQSN